MSVWSAGWREGARARVVFCRLQINSVASLGADARGRRTIKASRVQPTCFYSTPAIFSPQSAQRETSRPTAKRASRPHGVARTIRAARCGCLRGRPRELLRKLFFRRRAPLRRRPRAARAVPATPCCLLARLAVGLLVAGCTRTRRACSRGRPRKLRTVAHARCGRLRGCPRELLRRLFPRHRACSRRRPRAARAAPATPCGLLARSAVRLVASGCARARCAAHEGVPVNWARLRALCGRLRGRPRELLCRVSCDAVRTYDGGLALRELSLRRRAVCLLVWLSVFFSQAAHARAVPAYEGALVICVLLRVRAVWRFTRASSRIAAQAVSATPRALATAAAQQTSRKTTRRAKRRMRTNFPLHANYRCSY